MALRLWTGPSGSGKTRFLFEYVLDEAKKNRELNYIVIVPEQFTLSTQRELIKLSKDHGILNVDVLSFARLAYKIFEEVGFKDARGVAIDDMGKNLILRHIAAKCEEKLTVFNGKMDKLGYITEVKSAISEFMQYGITVDKLPEMIKTAKDSGRAQLACKLADMEILYREFNAYIDQKYITKEEILTKAKRAAYKSNRLKKSVVVFDGFTGFTPVQYSFLEALLQISRDIHVTILTDTRDNITYNTQHELFYLGYKTSNRLKKLAELNNIGVINDFEIKEEIPRRFLENHGTADEDSVTSEMLRHLEKNLFREYSKPFKEVDYVTEDCKTPTKVVNEEIGVFSALQPIDEVRKVAVEIQKSIRNSDLRYRDFAIATGDMETYAPLFKRIFKEYNIPYFIDKTFPVLMNPLIEYIRAIIDVINENFAYSAVFRYLRSPISDYETSDIDVLENFVLKYGIKGVNVWRTDWTEKYGRYFKSRSNSNENEASEELITIDNIRKKVMDNLSNVSILITDGKKKRGEVPTKTVNDINAVFMRVLEEQNIESRLSELYEKYSVTDELFKIQHEKEYKNIYGLVVDLIDRMSELLGDEKITYKEYGELLEAGFDEIRIGVIPTITDYIQIGDTTRSRFKDIHTLFIVGVNDGVIPKSSSSGGIISDIEKEFLIEYTPDIELAPTVREQAYTGQLYLYMLMTKPSHRLMLSYSRLNSDSDSIRPSYIIKVIKDMFPMLHVEKDINSEDDKAYSYSTLYDLAVRNIKDEDYSDIVSMLAFDETYGERFRRGLLLAADASYMSGVLAGSDSISKSVASILYGSAIVGSVTKLEQYARCSLSFFLKYGLSLKEREIYSFEARDMGSVFHSVMEKYSKYVDAEGLSWIDAYENHSEEFVTKAINECISDEKYSVLQSTFRHKYMIERIKRISIRSIEVLTKHLEAGKFSPKGAEIRFSSTNNLDSLTFKLSDDEIMRFTGSIDRLDTYEVDDKVYIKIIDYKSGNKSFDLVEVYKGLSLQLALYMNAATEMVSRESEHLDKEIIPAGILYYHIDDPIVDGTLTDSNDEISGKIFKELRMRGLVNSDSEVYRLIDKDFDKDSDIIPVSLVKSGDLSKKSSAVSTEDFETISKFVNKKIEDIGREILSGNIKAEPKSAAGIDCGACGYCPYVDICKFTGSINEFTDEDATDDTEVKKDNVLEKMREEI